MSIRAPFFVLTLAALLHGRTDAQSFTTTPLPEKRDTHGSVILGRTLYVLGGAETEAWKPTASVLRAPIGEDLRVGAWTATTPLPQRTLYIGASTVARGSVIYVVGGQNRMDDRAGDIGDKRVRTSAYFGRVNAAGDVTSWQETAPWSTLGGLACSAAVTERALYVCGGADTEDRPSPAVFFAPLSPDGTPEPWQGTSPLPDGLWFHKLVIHKETALVFGGRKASGPSASVYRSRLREDGSLFPWQVQESPYPAPALHNAFASTERFVFGIGGVNPAGALLGAVVFGSPSPSGIDSWKTTRMPEAQLQRHSAAASGELGVLLITGGRLGVDYSLITNDVVGLPLRRDADVKPPVDPATACALPYEEALTEVRQTGANMLVVTVSAAAPRSLDLVRSFCVGERTMDPSARLTVLRISDAPEVARRLGLVQAGLVAYVSPGEVVLGRSSAPYPNNLPEITTQ